MFLLLWILLIPGLAFSQQSIDLKFQGRSDLGSIALVISNRAPIYPELIKITGGLTAKSYRIALVKKEMDIIALNKANSPFVEEVEYVLKISVNNQSTRESVLDLVLEFLVLKTGKIFTEQVSIPRSSLFLLVEEIEKLMKRGFPEVPKATEQIVQEVSENGMFTIPPKEGLKQGDEIFIRYKSSRSNILESPAMITKITYEAIHARDVNQQVKKGDTISPIAPKRNRLGVYLHAMVPLVGSQKINIFYDGANFNSDTRWPAGFRILGEYERLLPYNLVSTTTFGIAVDMVFGTELFTGLGYRIFYRSWEFLPYLRIGGQYSPLALKNGARILQGMLIRFGVNLGMSFSYRLTRNMYLGLDLGVVWYPLEYIGLVEETTKIDLGNAEFNLSELYPYIGIKFGWLF